MHKKNKQPQTKSTRFSRQGTNSLFTASLNRWSNSPRFSRSLNKIVFFTILSTIAFTGIYLILVNKVSNNYNAALNGLENVTITQTLTPTFSPTPTPTLTLSPTPSPTPTLTPTPIPTLIPTPSKPPVVTKHFFITFYGWPDNTPSGRAIAYPRHRFPAAKHDETGGVGTYNDPITFASDPNHIPVGTIYYVPYLKKYILMEDLCVGCVESWSTSVPHIDIWMESNENFSGELVTCQRKWTRKDIEVYTSPPSNLPVNTIPIFDKATGSCSEHF